MKKKLLLGVSGSVAVYKACEIASECTQKNLSVRVAMTPSAASLISPVLFRALTGEAAVVDEFSVQAPSPMTHIDFADCDLFLAAPASADLIGRLACGLANDLVTTVALALDKKTPKLIAPAMNSKMFANPLVQKNMKILVEAGFEIIEPESGYLACGISGPGRLAEPKKIVEIVLRKIGG